MSPTAIIASPQSRSIAASEPATAAARRSASRAGPLCSVAPSASPGEELEHGAAGLAGERGREQGRHVAGAPRVDEEPRGRLRERRVVANPAQRGEEHLPRPSASSPCVRRELGELERGLVLRGVIASARP